MITLDSTQIWQWDINHTVTTDTADEVHFALAGDKEAYVVMPTVSGSSYKCNVPNILIQRYGTMLVWRVIDGKTTESVRYEVRYRARPQDYVYEETVVESYEEIKQWFEDSVNDLSEQTQSAINNTNEAANTANQAASNANTAATSATAAASAASDAAAAARGNVLAGSETGRIVTVDDAYAAKPREVRVKGRTVNNLWRNPTGSSNGVTATETDDGALQVSGTATPDATINTGYIYSLRQGSQITARCDRAPVAGMVFAVYFFDADGSSVGYFDAITSSQTQASHTVPSGAAYAQCRVYVPGGVTASGTYHVMLIEGSSAPDCFVAPGLRSIDECAIEIGTQEADPSASSTPVDLDGRELRSLPDGTCDELVVAMDGSCEIIKRVGAVTFDGSSDEGWVFDINRIGLAKGAPGATSVVDSGNAYCDTLPVRNVANATAITSYSAGWVDIRNSTQITSTETGKAWLASNPTTYVYPLATPQTIPLPAVTLPALPAPDATVWADTGAIPTDVVLTYERDISIVINNLESKIADIVTIIESE